MTADASSDLPAARRVGRVLAMQTLYEHDVTGVDALDALRARLEDEPAAPRAAAFAKRLVRGTVEHLGRIDGLLQETAPSWPIGSMPEVDKAILRLALYELIVDNKAPFRVVINEAVELAKAYGGEHSGRFVNGVLGTVASQARTTIGIQHDS